MSLYMPASYYKREQHKKRLPIKQLALMQMFCHAFLRLALVEAEERPVSCSGLSFSQ